MFIYSLLVDIHTAAKSTRIEEETFSFLLIKFVSFFISTRHRKTAIKRRKRIGKTLTISFAHSKQKSFWFYLRSFLKFSNRFLVSSVCLSAMEILPNDDGSD